MDDSDDQLRAVCLAAALADGPLRARIYDDWYSEYYAEPWVELAQEASRVLVGVASGLLANYLAALAFRPRPSIRITDLYTREVHEGVTEYKRAVDRLRQHRVAPKSRAVVDVLLMSSDRAIRVLEQQGLQELDLLELLEELRGLPEAELERRVPHS